MIKHDLLRIVILLGLLLLLLVYFAVELGWGGGDPNNKDHNSPPQR